MSENKFSVSQDFAVYEMRAESSLKEVRQSEARTSGVPLEVGTYGIAEIIGCEGVTSKQTIDPVTKQPKGGNPMQKMVFAILTAKDSRGNDVPCKGIKVYRNFVFNTTANMSDVQRYQMWLDFLENCGMPRDVRTNGKTSEYLNWMGSQPRQFKYEIVANQYENGGKVLQAVPTGVAEGMPTATATSAAMSAATSAPTSVVQQTVPTAPTLTPGDKVEYSSYEAEVLKVEGDNASIRFVHNNRTIEVSAADCKLKQ